MMGNQSSCSASVFEQYMQLYQYCSLIEMHVHLHTQGDPHLFASSLVSQSKNSQFNPDDGMVALMTERRKEMQ